MSCTLTRGMAENFVEPCELIFTMPYAPLNHRVRKTPMIISGHRLRQAAYEMWIGHKLKAENLLGVWGKKNAQSVWVVNAAPFAVDVTGLVEDQEWFPIELPRRILTAYPGKKDVVADPFMGRGTVGKAVLEYGGTFIGVDRSPDRVTLAREYLNAA